MWSLKGKGNIKTSLAQLPLKLQDFSVLEAIKKRKMI